jgi:hypothetical protein
MTDLVLLLVAFCEARNTSVFLSNKQLLNSIDTENRALLGYYAASSGNLPTFRHILWGPIFRDQEVKTFEFLASEDGIDKLSRNVRKLPLLAAQKPRRAQF